MRYQGKLTNWKDDKGFGFITPNGGGQQVFVHIKSFGNRQRRPVGNEIVIYELKADAEGRPRAERVALVGEPLPSAASSGHSKVPLALIAAFFVFLAGAVVAGKLPLVVIGLYFATSIVAFVAYAFDKSAARHDRWRTQESTLHLFGLVGGWPGALAAQRLIRHKCKKQSFQIVFWITVLLNCSALGWLFSERGAAGLRSVLEEARILF